MAWVIHRSGVNGPRYVGVYRDLRGSQRSAGVFDLKRDAARAAREAESQLLNGNWIDPTDGRITFRDYVEQHWWPSRHIEATTKAGYRCLLDKHFLPFFGDLPMRSIVPSTVQAWVTEATPRLSPRSVRKAHVMLHSVFRRAVRDRVILHNPARETELPKVVTRPLRILSPQEFDQLLTELEPQHAVMVLTAIETGCRWGEVVALRPSDVDFFRRTVNIQRVIIEVSKKITGAGTRATIRNYPKDNEPRTIRISPELVTLLSQHIAMQGLDRDDLLFSSTGEPGAGPMSRNTFRSRVWLPAIQRANLGFSVRFHDLRHAHASWSLAGGADLKAVMDRMGHAQISTTQRYLHSLPDSDDRALAAFSRIRNQTS
ncbi:MAG: hypothetical protein QOG53_3112 [Frankiales bacterium]|nr:hypothetical protein [Frankiales bacterium]